MEAERRFEPWPWILAAMLAAMIATSLTFFWIARSNPDPVLAEDTFEWTPPDAGGPET